MTFVTFLFVPMVSCTNHCLACFFFLQFIFLNNLRRNITQIRTRVNQNRNKMVGDHTFHFHHWGLAVCLPIVQSYMNCWNTLGHIINRGNLLDFVDSLNTWIPMREVPKHMPLSIAPTFQWFLLRTFSPSQGWSKNFISTLRWKFLLIHTFCGETHPRTLPIILKPWRFNTLLLECHLSFLLPFLGVFYFVV